MSWTTASRAAGQHLVLALAIVANSTSASAAGAPLPSWPQSFYVNAMEPHGFGLPVTAAGTITVSVHAQGAPIVVTLSRPDRTPAQQAAGTGELRISYPATAADVALSPLWHIGITLQQPAPGAQASGSVQVQGPPIDASKVAAFLAQPRPPRAPPDAAAKAAMLAAYKAKVEATQRAFEQARAAHQAARFEAIRPRLEAAKARAAQTVSTRAVLPLTTTVLTAPNVVRAPVTQPIAVAPPTTTVLTAPNAVKPPVMQPLPLPSPPPPPVIALPLYTDQVEPRDTFQITGSGFGTQGPGSAVHFVFGTQPTDNYVAQITTWTDGEIFVTVPPVGGYVALTGTLYVVRADGAISQYVSFQFTPAMGPLWLLPAREITGSISQKVFPNSTLANYDNGWCSRVTSTYPPSPTPPFGTPPDLANPGLVNPTGWIPWPPSPPIYGWAPTEWYEPTYTMWWRGPYDIPWVPCDGAGGAFNGYKGDDVFTLPQKNGFFVNSVSLDDQSASIGCGSTGGGAGAYVSAANPPTVVAGNIQVDVRVWADACLSGDNHPYYVLSIWLQGPIGLSPFQ